MLYEWIVQSFHLDYRLRSSRSNADTVNWFYRSVCWIKNMTKIGWVIGWLTTIGKCLHSYVQGPKFFDWSWLQMDICSFFLDSRKISFRIVVRLVFIFFVYRFDLSHWLSVCRSIWLRLLLGISSVRFISIGTVVFRMIVYDRLATSQKSYPDFYGRWSEDIEWVWGYNYRLFLGLRQSMEVYMFIWYYSYAFLWP